MQKTVDSEGLLSCSALTSSGPLGVSLSALTSILPLSADTEARLCEYLGFVVKYCPGLDFNAITLVELIGSPLWLTYYFSFQLKKKLSPATMKTFHQALDKAVNWAVERVCACPASSEPQLILTLILARAHLLSQVDNTAQ